MDNEENPPVLGGAYMPPSSPQKKKDNLPFALKAVGIPTSKRSRKIKSIDVTSYEEGYDSDGEMGPFYDAVAGKCNECIAEVQSNKNILISHPKEL